MSNLAIKEMTQNWIEKGNTCVENSIIYDNTLSPQARMLYIQLKGYSFGKENCYPSQTTLAKHNNVTERTIYNWIQELIEKDLVKVIHRKKTSNIYLLTNMKSISDKQETLYNRKPVSDKERKSFNNNNKQNLNFYNLSKQLIKTINNNFKYISQVMINDINQYINDYGYSEQFIFKVLNDVKGNTYKFFENRMKMLIKDNIRSIEQLKHWNINQRNKKVQYIRNYKKKKSNNNKQIKESIIIENSEKDNNTDEPYICKVQSLIKQKYNKFISISTVEFLLHRSSLPKVVKLIAECSNFYEFKAKAQGYR